MKRLISIILALTICLSLGACGEESVTNSNNTTPVNNIATEKAEEKTEIKEAGNSFEKFDKSSEWDTVEWLDRAIQVDETMIYLTQSVDEVITKLKNSNVNYEIEYNKDRLMEPEDQYTIHVKLNGSPWVKLLAINVLDEIKTLGECPLMYVDILTSAKDYCRLVDGRTLKELQNITYDELKSDEFALKISCQKPTNQSTQISPDDNQILIDFDASTTNSPISYSKYCSSSYAITPIIHYYALINKDTGKVDKFDTYFGDKYYTSMNYYEKQEYMAETVISSFKQISEKGINTIFEYVLEDIKNNYIPQKVESGKFTSSDVDITILGAVLYKKGILVGINVEDNKCLTYLKNIKLDENKDVISFDETTSEDIDFYEGYNFKESYFEPLNGYIVMPYKN